MGLAFNLATLNLATLNLRSLNLASLPTRANHSTPEKQTLDEKQAEFSPHSFV